MKSNIHLVKRVAGVVLLSLGLALAVTAGTPQGKGRKPGGAISGWAISSKPSEANTAYAAVKSWAAAIWGGGAQGLRRGM